MIGPHRETLESLSDWLDIDRPICVGGMGAIYRAELRSNGTPIALKVMQEQQAAQTGRFLREARILSQLWHPGIVRYVAHGTTRSGAVFLAMEWLDGEDLASRLARAGITPTESVALVRRVAEALTAAHERGVVHRDLKPSNLFLPDGDVDRVKILDFGVARFAQGSLVTRTGAVVGTPAYMAPEQARGIDRLDARADVFSLGCVLFECLTGRPAFSASHPVAVMAQIIFEDPPALSRLRPDLPQRLDDLLGRMLAKDPSCRPASAAEVADALAGITELPGGLVSTAPRQQVVALTGTERRLMCAILVADALPADVPARTGAQGESHTLADSPAFARTVDGATGSSALRAGLSVYERLRGAAENRGGQLTPLADGSVVAIFASDGSATDLAVRAADCSLAMRAIVPEAPISLATGSQVMGGDMPVGEVIERQVEALRAAARGARSSRAPIRIDDITAGLLDARFDVRGDAGGLLLRGKRDLAEQPRRLLGRRTDCVGRERELSLLEEIFDECAEEPVARCVLVTAGAGVGKTRLRQEFLHRLAASDRGADIWIAQGDPTSKAPPFDILGRALRRAFGIRDDDPRPVQRRKLRARVGRHFTGEPRERVSVFLGEMVGVPFDDRGNQPLRAARRDAAAMDAQCRLAFEELLEAECRVRPIAIVLEDLHWGDHPSVQYLDAALRKLRDLPLFVFATARLELHDRFPGLWFDRGVEELRLHALRRSTCTRLVKRVLGADTPRDIVKRLVEQSSGNAFYLEELMRAQARGDDAAPPTVLAMVQTRLERFPSGARRLLRAASVFGDRFNKAGVVVLLGGEQADNARLDDWLELLEAQEVIARRRDGHASEEVEYEFIHAYMREAAYAMLTDEDRELASALADIWKLRRRARSAHLPA